ncbi:coiled-coil domain-containing protein 18 isoform X1 [Ascaphus truei]|uniref:coiled-coil domain-containing protein 18 isoform X1 n=3 Tax=Ascaphus truei TaxID=8439 RepID=UPI003F598B03
MESQHTLLCTTETNHQHVNTVPCLSSWETLDVEEVGRDCGKNIKPMESNLPTHQNQKKEPYGGSVKSLRSKLMQTEWSLQSVEEQLSSDSSNDHSLSRFPLGLTLDDLEQPSHSELRQDLPSSRNKMALNSGGSRGSAGDKPVTVPAESLKTLAQENKQFREKLNSLREHNVSLVSQNHSLMDKIESVQSELTKSKSRVRFFESALCSHTSRIPELEEQIVSLGAEAEAHGKALRHAEDQLEQSRHAMAEKDHVLQKFREELKKLKIELYECYRKCKRAEKQRNQALLNAEELTRAFQQYKKNVAEKLETVQVEDGLLKKNFTNCEKEREALQEKCQMLEAELGNMKEHLGTLKSEKGSDKERRQCIEAKNAELISLLTQSNQRILKLESELENKEKVIRENNSLLHEMKEWKVRVACQNETRDFGAELDTRTSMPQLQYDKALLGSSKYSDHPLQRSSPVEGIAAPNSDASKLLIADLRMKLSIKEAENRKLQAKLTSSKFTMNNYSVSSQDNDTFQAEPVKLITIQTEEGKCLKPEHLCRELQADKERLDDHMKELQRKLTKAQAEVSNTKLSMAQRTSQFQLIQEELLEKASKTTNLEHELAKKCSKITSLQKQLGDETVAHSAAASRNVELEQELMECKDHIIDLEENISKEHDEVLLAFEKSKKIHLEEHKDLENQIEHFQHQLEIKNFQVLEQDHSVKALQQDILSKQRQLESLDHILTKTKRELDLQTKNTGDAIKMLQNQVEEETVKVRQLESALAVCKEELVLYLHQLEDNSESFEKQTKKKSEEVQRLQKELKSRTLSLQEISEENVRLQQTLQQQQQMLQQATIRIGDLEDTQAELEKQVSKLEHELQNQRSNSEEEVRRTEENLHAAHQELEFKTQQVLELSNSFNQIKCELDLWKEKFTQREDELVARRRDGETKTNRLSYLETTLQKTQAELDKKADLLAVLEEKLYSTEKDIKRKDELESELRNVKEELHDTVKHRQELQEMLTNTQSSLEQKKVALQDLAEELRTCKSELEDRDHELLDMDQALTDRNWELKQRAAQLTQLDVTIREHKGEMEQKIIRLESALEKSELKAKDHINQITSLDEQLQQARDQVCEKDFELLQKDQMTNQLKKDIERKRLIITDVEKTMKEQEHCISEQHQDGIDLSQQVRLAREQMQHTHLELMETRQQLAEAQRESDRLTHKLEEMELLSREKLQYTKNTLEEAQDTICNLKTELQARNEVIQATNEVLILKESELTRLSARISGYERTLSLKQQHNAIMLPLNSLSEHNPRHSCKRSQILDSKNWGMRRSISDSDINLLETSSLVLPKSTLEDWRNMLLPDSTPLNNNEWGNPHLSSDSLNDSSFNPLAYGVDDCDTASDCTDLGTLSGMLKYIKKEMKVSEASHVQSPSKNMWVGDECQGKQE